MDSARKVPPSIAVTFGQDAEALKKPNAVFHYDAQPCQGTIGLLVGITQGLFGRFFLGRDAVGMQLGNALIALVG
jgi:hypothetical protein